MVVYRGALFAGERSEERFSSFLSSSLVPIASKVYQSSLLLSERREERDREGEAEGKSRREFVTVACEFWRRHLKLIASRWQDIWSFIYIERLHRLKFLEGEPSRKDEFASA